MSQTSRIETLLQYISEDPEDAFTKYLLALEYLKAGDDQKALVWMENVYTRNSGYLPNYYHYGKLLEKGGRKDMALKIFEEGMVIARKEMDVHTYSELQGAAELL